MKPPNEQQDDYTKKYEIVDPRVIPKSQGSDEWKPGDLEIKKGIYSRGNEWKSIC